tara:strand:+ start:70 stop:447 length:378 start_codon:yes stop_codon:yes gene_type:complete
MIILLRFVGDGEFDPFISNLSSDTLPPVPTVDLNETLPALWPAFEEIAPVATCLFTLCVVKVWFVPVGICCVKIVLFEQEEIIIKESCSTVRVFVLGVEEPPEFPNAPMPPELVKLFINTLIGFH